MNWKITSGEFHLFFLCYPFFNTVSSKLNFYQVITFRGDKWSWHGALPETASSSNGQFMPKPKVYQYPQTKSAPSVCRMFLSILGCRSPCPRGTFMFFGIKTERHDVLWRMMHLSFQCSLSITHHFSYANSKWHCEAVCLWVQHFSWYQKHHYSIM